MENNALPTTREIEIVPGISSGLRYQTCYGPRLQQTYALRKENAARFPSLPHIKKNPLESTTDEVFYHIVQLPNCDEAARIFGSEHIDGLAFLSLRQNDITDLLKIKMGPAIKIYNQIVQLREIVVTKFTEKPGDVKIDENVVFFNKPS